MAEKAGKSGKLGKPKKDVKKKDGTEEFTIMDRDVMRQHLLDGTMTEASNLLKITDLVAVDKGTVERLRNMVSARNKQLVEANYLLAGAKKEVDKVRGEHQETIKDLMKRLEVLEVKPAPSEEGETVETMTVEVREMQKLYVDRATFKNFVETLSKMIDFTPDPEEDLLSDASLNSIMDRLEKLGEKWRMERSCRDTFNKIMRAAAGTTAPFKKVPVRTDKPERDGTVKQVPIGHLTCEKCHIILGSTREYLEHQQWDHGQ